MSDLLLIISYAYGLLVGSFCAYKAGQMREWSRVIDYLHAHESDKSVSRLATGIVMDEHHQRVKP